MPVPLPVAARVAARHRALPPLPLEEDEGTRRGVDPLLFHTANLVAHAGVSALVLRWVLGERGWPGPGVGTGEAVEGGRVRVWSSVGLDKVGCWYAASSSMCGLAHGTW